jgi:hypothetical protein
MRVGLVAMLLVALAAPARGDDTRLDENAVGVIVQGGGSLRGKVASYIAKRLRRDGYTAVDDPLSKNALDTLANCFIIEDLACARGVVEARARTPRLVFGRIDDSTGEITLDLTWFSYGRAPVPAKASCARCNESWQDHTDDLLARLTASAEMPILPAPDPQDTPRKPRSRLWPTLLVGAGTAALLAGSVLAYYGLRDGASHKYLYPQLTPVGITLIAVGGGAVIGGIITW